jgi:hypothetical protein
MDLAAHLPSGADRGYLLARSFRDGTMKYLCLIYLNEDEMDAMPAHEMDALNERHLDFNDGLRKSGHFVEAEALAPGRATAKVRVRKGSIGVTDGPYAESKELVAGFYLIEAVDMEEAIAIASHIPSASLATIEVRPTRQLIVPGRTEQQREIGQHVEVDTPR